MSATCTPQILGLDRFSADAQGFAAGCLMPWISLFLSLGVLFGALAGAAAYTIFYREYLHHFVNANKARVLALRGALTAFLVFVGISVVAGYVITHFIIPSRGSVP
jgi:hypothetical protein